MSGQAVEAPAEDKEHQLAGSLPAPNTPANKQTVVQRKAPEGPVFREATIAIEDEGDRIFKVVASDETPDRYGDIVRASGWRLENYVRNPVLLFGHKSGNPPIGDVPDIGVKGTSLIAYPRFMPKGMYDFADTLWLMVKEKFLRAVSVGFLPLRYDAMFGEKDEFLGYEFIEQELLELSVVPIPANPNALQLAKSFGLGERQIAKLFADDPQVQANVSAFHQRRRRELELIRLGVSSKYPV